MGLDSTLWPERTRSWASSVCWRRGNLEIAAREADVAIVAVTRRRDRIALSGDHATRRIDQDDDAVLPPARGISVRPDHAASTTIAPEREPVRSVGDQHATNPCRCADSHRWLGLNRDRADRAGATGGHDNRKGRKRHESHLVSRGNYSGDRVIPITSSRRSRSSRVTLPESTWPRSMTTWRMLFRSARACLAMLAASS